VIYEITRELAAALRKRACPIPVVYGPEATRPTVIGHSRIMVERPRGRSTDTWSDAKTHPAEPRTTGSRTVPLLITVYASSTLAGAREPDHTRLMDDILNVLRAALHEVLGRRRSFYRVTSAGMPSEVELDMTGMEQWSGAVYALQIAVGLTMTDTNFKGEGRATLELEAGDIESTTSVKLPGQIGTGETACGGN
jgi:hypothetical protein